MKATKHYFECDHDTPLIRTRVDKGGRTTYFKQCQQCGYAIGPAVKGMEARANGIPPPWDQELDKSGKDLYKQSIDRRNEEYAANKEREDEEWRERYNEHLNSDKWRRLRQLVMNRCGGMCEGCDSKPAVQVHHLTYAHMGDEFLWELKAVCIGCHRRLHDHMRDMF